MHIQKCMIEFYKKKKKRNYKRNDTFTNENIKKRHRKIDKLYAPSYVCQSAKFFNPSPFF